MPDLLFGPAPDQDAIDFIKSKPVVSRQVFDGLLPELKARAFTITGIEGANVLQTVRDRIADLPAGHTWDDIKADLVDDISPFLVDPHAPDDERAAQEDAAERRAELLLRTHGFQAYQAAQYRVMDRQRDVLPFWQYLTMEDDRVRPEHAALDKIVLPADSPFWSNHFPPWDWGCRCQVVPLSPEDRDDIAAADEKRAPDARLVLEGPQATHLEQGTLVRSGRTFDVRAPDEKEGGSGFTWDPSSLQLPLDQLKARYDAPVWAEFEAWARKTELNETTDRTVWEMAGGKASLGRRARRLWRTVWDWLTDKAKAWTAPPPHGLDDIIARHTALPGTMTTQEAENVIAALKQGHGITAADTTTITAEHGVSPQWEPYVTYEINQLLSFIPKPVLDTLPKFETRLLLDGGSNLASYNMGKKILKLNTKKLMGNAALISETIYHELMHWVHLHGPRAYRDAIQAHYAARTHGERTATLPGYGPDTRGKKDKFWDVYMGREYQNIVDGSEIPTMVFELLANPAKFAKLWNEPLHRGTIKAALSILFP